MHVAVSGLLMQAVQFGAFYVALTTGLPAAVVALVQGLNPVVVALVATRVLGEKLAGRQWLGFGLGCAGCRSGRFRPGAVSPPRALILCVVGLLWARAWAPSTRSASPRT